MSLVFLPSPIAAVLSRNGIFVPEWFRFFRDLRRGAGLDADAPIYRELATSPVSSGLIGTATVAAVAGATSVYAVSCPDGSTTGTAWTLKLPRDYREGTPLVPYWDFTAVVAANAAVWQLAFGGPSGSGDVIADAYSTQVVSAFDGTARKVHRVTGTAFNGATALKGDVLGGSLVRLGAHGSDSLAGAAYLLGLGFLYQIDGTGSEAATP